MPCVDIQVVIWDNGGELGHALLVFTHLVLM